MLQIKQAEEAYSPLGPQFFLVWKDDPENPSCSDIWNVVAVRRVCLPGGLDLEVSQESVVVGREVLSQLVALE